MSWRSASAASRRRPSVGPSSASPACRPARSGEAAEGRTTGAGHPPRWTERQLGSQHRPDRVVAGRAFEALGGGRGDRMKPQRRVLGLRPNTSARPRLPLRLYGVIQRKRERTVVLVVGAVDGGDNRRDPAPRPANRSGLRGDEPSTSPQAAAPTPPESLPATCANPRTSREWWTARPAYPTSRGRLSAPLSTIHSGYPPRPPGYPQPDGDQTRPCAKWARKRMFVRIGSPNAVTRRGAGGRVVHNPGDKSNGRGGNHPSPIPRIETIPSTSAQPPVLARRRTTSDRPCRS